MKEKEKQFFECIGYPPILLSNCSFKNLMKYGIELGTDVCPYMEIKNPCNSCEYSEEQSIYPQLSDSTYLYLASIAFSNIEIPVLDYSLNTLKTTILDLIICKCINEELKQKIKEHIEYVYSSLSHTDFWI